MTGPSFTGFILGSHYASGAMLVGPGSQTNEKGNGEPSSDLPLSVADATPIRALESSPSEGTIGSPRP